MSKVKKVKIGTDEYDIGVNYANVDNAPSIPTKLSELQNDSGFISQEVEPQFNASASKDITSQDISNWNAKADISDIPDVSDFITKDVNNLTNYELKVSTANNILMTLNNTTYELTLSLRNSNNEVLNTQSVDLPLESVVVDGEYDSTNKKIILELQNGNTIDVPVGDLINGLQSEITSSNKLDASLVDDSLSTNKFTNSTEKTAWNAKYDKPSTGIPKTDLAQAVQDSLDLADSAIQSNDLASVATSGDYDDLSNKPTIPDISGKEDTSNKVSTIDAQSTNTQYAGAKAVWDLVSGLGGGLNVDYFGTAMYETFVFDEHETGIYFVKSSNYARFDGKKSETGNTQQLDYFKPIALYYYKDVNEVEETNTDFALLYGIKTGYDNSTYGTLGTVRISLVMANDSLYYDSFRGMNIKLLADATQKFNSLKIFDTTPRVETYTAPTQDTQLTPKKYVDDQITAQIGNINTILATLTTPSNGGGE